MMKKDSGGKQTASCRLLPGPMHFPRRHPLSPRRVGLATGAAGKTATTAASGGSSPGEFQQPVLSIHLTGPPDSENPRNRVSGGKGVTEAATNDATVGGSAVGGPNIRTAIFVSALCKPGSQVERNRRKYHGSWSMRGDEPSLLSM